MNVFSPVQTMNNVKTASPNVSNLKRVYSYSVSSSNTPPNSCIPKIAKTVKKRKNTKQKLTILRTPLTTAANTCLKARCFRSPFKPAKIRNTLNVRSVAIPSAPEPTANSTIPEITTTPSTTFHGLHQYFQNPSAMCFSVNSAIKTEVNTSSHVFSTL